MSLDGSGTERDIDAVSFAEQLHDLKLIPYKLEWTESHSTARQYDFYPVLHQVSISPKA